MKRIIISLLVVVTALVVSTSLSRPKAPATQPVQTAQVRSAHPSQGGNADKHVTINPKARQKLVELGFDPDRFHTVSKAEVKK